MTPKQLTDRHTMPVTPPQPPISTIPPITILPALPPSAQIAVLSALFEPSDALQEIALPLLLSGGFGSYVAWIDVIGKQLRSLAESASSNDIRALDEILRAHPRLGEKKIQSIRSGAEQASLHGSPDDEGRLRELNQRYEQVFPGLRYMYVSV